jgi:hypothetical protein
MHGLNIFEILGDFSANDTSVRMLQVNFINYTIRDLGQDLSAI